MTHQKNMGMIKATLKIKSIIRSRALLNKDSLLTGILQKNPVTGVGLKAPPLTGIAYGASNQFTEILALLVVGAKRPLYLEFCQ